LLDRLCLEHLRKTAAFMSTGAIRPACQHDTRNVASSADHGGALGVLAIVALAQGLGVAVALVWLTLGHNPLSRE
jgi:hypothetical protein